jgi:hypothetical protein
MSNSKLAAIIARTAERRARGLIPDYSRHKKTAPKTLRTSLPCLNLLPPTGETRPCQACGGKTVAVPLHGCKVFGVCTTTRVVKLADGTPVKPCNSLCPSYAPA